MNSVWLLVVDCYRSEISEVISAHPSESAAKSARRFQVNYNGRSASDLEIIEVPFEA